MASLHFFDSLSDEQKRLWEEMQSPAAPMAVEPEDSSIFAAAPAPLAPTPDGPFYAPGKAAATVIEVQVIGTLVLLYFRSDVRAAQQWVLNAESDADRVGRCGLDGQVWAPPSSSPTWATHGPVLKPLDTALSVRIGGGEVETAAAVVSTWSGSVGVVTPAQVDAYVVALRTSKSKRRIAGPVRDMKGSASPRHVAAIPAVAALLRVSGRVLRDRVAVLATEPTFEPKCSKADLHERLEAAEQQNKVLQQKLTHANQLKSQAQLLAKEKGKMRIADTVAAQVSKVRSRVESEYDDKLLREKARAQGELERATAAMEKKLVQAKRLKTDAHAEKRGERARAEAQSELADTRLGKLKALKDKLAATEAECEELKAQPGADPTEMETLYESQGKVLAMDVWEREARGAGGGKGAKKFGFLWRTTAFAMMSNMTPQSAVVPNVRCVLRAVAPWLNIDEPSSRALTEWRFELRFIEEALAFMEVAGAYSIRMLGFDGTTKFGKPMMTSNVVIEPKKGAPLKAVILRASYLSPDGTAAGEAKTIETKCFARGRDFINRLMRRWVSMHPGLPWPGPEAAALSLARLAGGGALMSDTCATAEKTKRLLSEMIKEQATEMAREKMGDAWDGLSDEEKEHELRVHLLDCHQHMRNIFLKEMSAAQARHVAEELKPHLDNFSAWERMSTDFTQLLRATYKELHHTQRYYKGKGVEFSAWLLANYPSAFAIHFERADGGRQVTRPPDCGVSDLPAISPQSQPRLAPQDLDYDAAIAMYVNRKYIVEFLAMLVFSNDHSNVLEDFLYVCFTANEYIAMTRANAVIDLLISRPYRWLAGNTFDTSKLTNWSPLSMNRALNCVYTILERAAADGSVLLDSSLDVYAPITAEQRGFAEWRSYTYEEETVLAPDGKTPLLLYKLALGELLNPTDPTNIASRAKTVEYIEVQAAGGLRKLRDTKLALAKHVTALGGAYAYEAMEQAHVDTIGLDATNDRLAESVFGRVDMIMRRYPGITVEAASALAQALSTKSFESDGAFWQLSREMQEVLLEEARLSVRSERAVDRAHHKAPLYPSPVAARRRVRERAPSLPRRRSMTTTSPTSARPTPSSSWTRSSGATASRSPSSSAGRRAACAPSAR